MAKKKKSRAKKSAKQVARKATKQAPVKPETDFASDYGYVVGDLKRIGTLAAAMFGALFVLALIIR